MSDHQIMNQIKNSVKQKKVAKIDVAIEDAKLKLGIVNQKLTLLRNEKDILQGQLETLESIRDNKNYQ